MHLAPVHAHTRVPRSALGAWVLLRTMGSAPQREAEDRWRYDMLMDDPFMELPIMCTRLGEYISHSPTAHVTRVHVCKIVHGLNTDRAL